MMTTYERELIRQIEGKYPDLSHAQLIETLIRIGVVDFSRCKTLSVREYVDRRVREGETKTDAMWQAAENFACSYEYIRKCVYYYTDIHLP